MILPMTIPAEDKNIVEFLFFQPGKEGVGLGAESFWVGVIVALTGSVGPHHRGGGNENLPFGITFFERLFQPLPLIGPPK